MFSILLPKKEKQILENINLCTLLDYFSASSMYLASFFQDHVQPPNQALFNIKYDRNSMFQYQKEGFIQVYIQL